jgi:hypothetical protein
MDPRKQQFMKEWPFGADPPMTSYNYFNRRFREVAGYNWWLLPSVTKGEPKHWGVLSDDTVTMKFIHNGEFHHRLHEDTWERIGILVKTALGIFQLYVDEDAYLFPNNSTNHAVGQLSMDTIWDGHARLDLYSICHDYPYTKVPEWRS